MTFLATQVTRDGARIPVEVNSHVFSLNGKRVMFSIARDVTERKRVEEVLRESEARHRQLVEFLPDGIAVHNGNEILLRTWQEQHSWVQPVRQS